MIMTLPETRPSLLVRLHDPANDDAWREFVRIYEPAVYRFARRRGLQHADSVELTQEVLARVVRSIPAWDTSRTKGSFRSWLFAVARSRLIDAWRSSARSQAALGESLGSGPLGCVADDTGDDALSFELRKEMIRVAAESIRPEFHPSTWDAFVRTAISGEGVSEVASSLKLTAGAVYAARSRVLARLREVVRRTWDDFEASTEVLE
ncbi:MAG TPA: sigma-70 family RNA polymerase sigma factor [Caulifigura sp.]|nr:sigma-70 family RNA polymerase sigma factor [Caulifigura sp.]